jgi:hypothetical protein
MKCENCGLELIEVDNPLRRELRHPRGMECRPPRPTAEEYAQTMRGDSLEASDQRKRFLEAMRSMREMEDKAKLHYYKYLQRKEEIRIDIDREYAKRETLGHTKEHLIDERLGSDVAASSAAANNKWYISQATMYALMAQMELRALELKIFTPR